MLAKKTHKDTHTHARSPVLGLPLKSPTRVSLYTNTSNDVETAHTATPTVPRAMTRMWGRLSSDQADATALVASNAANAAKMRTIHDPTVHKASSRLTMTDSLKLMAENRT